MGDSVKDNVKRKEGGDFGMREIVGVFVDLNAGLKKR